MLNYLANVGVLWVGLIVGFFLKAWLQSRMSNYAGVLVKTVEDGRILYSLELHEHIEELEANDTITFKVVSSEESLNRD